MKIEEGYFEKIEYIDKLLNDDDILNEYIESLENDKFDIPSNIEEIVKFKVNMEKLNNSRKNNYKYLNALKVACFTLVVMITWTAMTNIAINNVSEEKTKEKVENVEKENKFSTIYGKVNEFTSEFSSTLLSPIEFKGGKR